MTSDSQDLISLIGSILKNRGAYVVNEQATKQGVVLPLVARLGWDRDNILEVAPEYTVGNGRVDYCLKRGDVPAVFLEVKRLDEPLDRHQEQLLRYAFEQGVTLAALTDGVRWWLYLPTQPDSSWEQRKFFTINLEEQKPEDVAAHFRKYLGKAEVLSGSALRAAQELHASHAKQQAIKEAIPIVWRELCEQPDPQLIELLSAKVEDRCGHKPDPEDLKRSIVRFYRPPDARAEPPRHPDGGTGLNRHTSAAPTNDRDWTFKKPVSFTFLGEQHPVSTFKGLLVGLAEILYDKNPDRFWTEVSQVGRSRGGRGYYAREFNRLSRQPAQIGHSGIWVETGFSANDIQARCHELLAAFSHSADDLRVELRPSSP